MSKGTTNHRKTPGPPKRARLRTCPLLPIRRCRKSANGAGLIRRTRPVLCHAFGVVAQAECAPRTPPPAGRGDYRYPKKSLGDSGDSPAQGRRRRRGELMSMMQTNPNEVALAPLCAPLDVPRASFYRDMVRAKFPPSPRKRTTPPRALCADERRGVLDTLHAPRFVDQPPH